jgi:hypothetical protein
MRGAGLGSAISLVHQQLQAVTVGVDEVDTAVLARAACNGNAACLQLRPERFVGPAATLRAGWLRSVPTVSGASPTFINGATP